MIGVIAAGVIVFLLLVVFGEWVKTWVPGVGFTPPPPSTGTLLSKLGQIILDYNNSQAYWVGGVTSYTVAAKGVTVHKIDAQQAEAIASELNDVVPSSAPMSIPCALMGSESVMDPQCQNGNYLGSNQAKDPWGFDDGACQLKLRDIEVNGKVGAAAFATAADAQAFAFDVTRAIPYFWGLIQSHLATADSLIAGNTNSAIDQRLMNRWIVAALLYKQGPTGGAQIFKSGVWPAELNNFVSLETFFADKLGIPSQFAPLPQ